MACNCKKKIALENEYGEKAEESLLEKGFRYLSKVIMFLIFIALAIVIIPVMVLLAVYKSTFGNGKIILPKFIGKYMKKNFYG